ncbi:MAG: stage II sporulation protein P [Clostridia bacterium]|nr:stage II sporulation protein P [Clostridia bacterium]
MVRIRVIHASKLLAVIAAAALAVALASLAFRSATARAENGRERAAVLAAFSFWTPPPMEFELPGETEGRLTWTAPDAAAEPTRPRARVLIYHTHTHEAYAQTAEDPYEETEPWRTADPSHSVARVGAALAELLEARGVEAVHDTTDHESPGLSTAYVRSLDTLMGYDQAGFDLRIDLHRDAWDRSLDACAYVGGRRAAQLMLLVGDGGSYDVKPDYEANLAFAVRLTERLNAASPGLCRPVMVKNGRYNQHVGTPSILVEVGHNLNTLEEALRAMPPLADALCALLTER